MSREERINFECDFCGKQESIKRGDEYSELRGWGIVTVHFFSPDTGENKDFCPDCGMTHINKLFTLQG